MNGRLSAERPGRALVLVIGSALRMDWRLALATVIVTPLLSGLTVLAPLWLRYLTDAALAHHIGASLLAAIALGTTVALGWYLWLAEAGLRITMTERVGFTLIRRMVELSVGISGLEHLERPQYLDRIQLLREAHWELGAGWSGLVNLANSAVQLVVTLILLASIDPWLLLLALVAPPGLLIERWMQVRTRQAEEAAAEPTRLRDDWCKLARDPATGREVRLFDLRAELVRRHAEAAEQASRLRLDAAIHTELGTAAQSLFATAGMIAAIVVLVLRAVSGEITVGQVLMGLTLVSSTVQRVTITVHQSGSLLTLVRAAARLGWLVSYARAQARVSEPLPAPSRLRRGIDVCRVSFRYPGTDAWVLRDLDLELKAGSVVALVGENGSGKTTLVKLLCAFYRPTEGSIVVDGSDLARIPAEEWRRRLAGAFQDYLRPEVSVREAVGIGDLPRIDSVPAVRQGLSRAGATDLEGELLHGLETQLGRTWEAGVDLSGGQWQKLALSRGLMRDAPLLLLLDEPPPRSTPRRSTNFSSASLVPLDSGLHTERPLSWFPTGSQRYGWQIELWYCKGAALSSKEPTVS